MIIVDWKNYTLIKQILLKNKSPLMRNKNKEKIKYKRKIKLILIQQLMRQSMRQKREERKVTEKELLRVKELIKI